MNKAKAVPVPEADLKPGEVKSLVAVEAYLYEPRDFFDLAVKHVPIKLEILAPRKIHLSMLDLTDIGVDLASVFFEASYYLAGGKRA